MHIRTLADETWAEDNDGSAALLRRHAARAGVGVRIDLGAADLPGKLALVATGHAIALVPGVLRRALRADVTTVGLVDAPTRGVYTITPYRDPHPCAAPLHDELTSAFAAVGEPMATSPVAAREAVAAGESEEAQQELRTQGR